MLPSTLAGDLDARQDQVSHDAHHIAGNLEEDRIPEGTATSAAAAVQDAQASPGVTRTTPHDDVTIATPGFTSAFFYDPYVEIKDFLDALTRNVRGSADCDFSVTTETSKSRDAGKGTPSKRLQNESATHQEAAAATQELDTEATRSVSLTPATTTSATNPAIQSEARTSAIAGAGVNGKTEDAVRPERSNSSTTSESVAESSQEAITSVAVPEARVSSKSRDIVEPQLRESGASSTQVEQNTDTPQQTKGAESSMAASRSSDKGALGFAASITASFAPQTRSAWAQLFGSRYEDEIESRANQASSSSTSRDEYQSEECEDLSESRLSLKAKLERERKLDQQIQASQQRFNERSLRRESPTPSLAASQQSPKRHSTATAPIPLKPFEMAGLSITSVRFCVEKALQATCKCFQQLHALALNEPRIPKAEVEHGVFVSQWELELLLQELFGSSREGGTIAPSLSGFALANPQYAGVPLELLLQITWFIPFDQLTRLRSLVLQITRKHLNEHKLAVLNRHLQKQLLLIPYSTRLQYVLLQFSDHRPRNNDLDDPDDDDDGNSIVSTAPPLVHCTSGLVRDLLECIAVPVTAALLTTLGDNDFLLLSPVRNAPISCTKALADFFHQDACCVGCSIAPCLTLTRVCFVV